MDIVLKSSRPGASQQIGLLVDNLNDGLPGRTTLTRHTVHPGRDRARVTHEHSFALQLILFDIYADYFQTNNGFVHSFNPMIMMIQNT